MKRKVYLSREDSVLLRQAISSLGKAGTFLEIGVGYGSNLIEPLAKYDLVAGTDIQDISIVKHAKKGNAELIVSDRASCFRNEVFDIVAFNPPYLPSDRVDDEAVDGGKGGIEVPINFLEDAIRVVKRGGQVLVLLSSESDLQEFFRYCSGRGLNHKIIAKREIFFESLFVYALEKPLRV